jgi:acyl-CoA dehydrogenase
MDFSLNDDQKRLIETARKFTKEKIIPVAQKLDEHGTFPKEICEQGWELGLMNGEVPPEYGGLGLSTLDHVLMMEEINYGCSGIGTTLAGNNLGAMPLILAGTEEQKKKYLGMLTDAPVFAAYACSEPDAGSDVAGMRSTVRKVGDEYVLNGQKRWITNGGVASWYTTFARTGDPKDRHKGITCFVVPRDLPGVSVGKKEDKLGQRASNTTDVLYDEVKLTKAHLVGEEGQGFKVAMKTFDRSRPWIAAGATGIMRRALDECSRYALERKAFGQPIGQFQAIQFMLAEMAMKYEATRLLMLKAAWSIGQGKLDAIDSSLAKAFGADAAMAVATDAVQVFGGYGYTKEYPVEKLMRDAKLLQIYEGTSQIQRMVIGRNLLAAVQQG